MRCRRMVARAMLAGSSGPTVITSTLMTSRSRIASPPASGAGHVRYGLNSCSCFRQMCERWCSEARRLRVIACLAPDLARRRSISRRGATVVLVWAVRDLTLPLDAHRSGVGVPESDSRPHLMP